MSQTQVDKPGRSATERAEELMDRMGQRIGYFTARAGQRIQETAASVREGTDRMNQPQTATGEKPSQPRQAQSEESDQLAMEKAEELVDRMSQRMSHFTSRVSLGIQKAAARMREEAEDMWAEAQNIRHQNSRKLQ